MSLQIVQFTATCDDAAEVDTAIEKLFDARADAERNGEEERRS